MTGIPIIGNLLGGPSGNFELSNTSGVTHEVGSTITNSESLTTSVEHSV